MKQQDAALIATGAGLLTGTAFLLLTLNVIPGLHVPPLWQLIAVLILAMVNVIAWQHMQNLQIGAMSVRESLKALGIGILVVSCFAVFDTILGFAFGARTIGAAFLHSGPLGGTADAFIFLCEVLLGIPTLVRATCLHYSR